MQLSPPAGRKQESKLIEKLHITSAKVCCKRKSERPFILARCEDTKARLIKRHTDAAKAGLHSEFRPSIRNISSVE